MEHNTDHKSDNQMHGGTDSPKDKEPNLTSHNNGGQNQDISDHDKTADTSSSSSSSNEQNKEASSDSVELKESHVSNESTESKEESSTSQLTPTEIPKSIEINLNKDSLMTILLGVQFLLLLVFGWQIVSIKKQISGLDPSMIAVADDAEKLADNNIDLESGGGVGSGPSDPIPAVKANIEINEEKDHIRGVTDAKITIVEYSDFECPFCSRAQPTIEQVMDKYIDDVNLVYRHFPLSFHANAQKAGEASECAADQGRFWEYHDLAFDNQSLLSAGVTQLKTWAGELGLNQALFDNCLDSGEKASIIAADQAEGVKLGVSGTPAFYINGRELVGAQPFSAFEQIIQAELNGEDIIVKEDPTPSAPGRQTITLNSNDHVKGPSDAAITIIEYSDFECPFCGRATPTVNQVLTTYGDQVRIVYRHFPLSFHANAQKAGEASECAADQGKFWEYHDKLFENQTALTSTNLKGYAAELGLNTAIFDGCLDSGEKASRVQSDITTGNQFGVTGTPAFFVNGIKLVGAQPFAAFQQVIDGEL